MNFLKNLMSNRFKFRVWDKKKKYFWFPRSNGQTIFEEVFDDEDSIPQQFTGLTDLNKKEIYEGDILNFSRIQKNNFYLHDNQFSGYVFFDINSCQYLIKRLDNDNCCLLKLELYLDGFDKEIIGNIYENPNLLLDNPKSLI